MHMAAKYIIRFFKVNEKGDNIFASRMPATPERSCAGSVDTWMTVLLGRVGTRVGVYFDRPATGRRPNRRLENHPPDFTGAGGAWP